VKLLRRDEREAGSKIEAHLSTKNAARAGTSAISFYDALVANFA
jgi:hypothetical protein